MERLEERQVLSGAPWDELVIEAPAATSPAAFAAPLIEPVLVAPIAPVANQPAPEAPPAWQRPTYFLSTENAALASQFTVSTLYTPEGVPQATVTFTGNADSLTAEVLELRLELRIGELVLGQHEVLIDFAKTAFLDAFLQDREDSALETVTVPPATSGTNNRSSAELLVLAKDHRNEVTLLTSAERQGAYTELGQLIALNSQAELGSDLEAIEAERTILGRAILLLAPAIVEDLSSTELDLKNSAQALRNAALGSLKVEHTLFIGFEANRELYRSAIGAGFDRVIAAVEENSIELLDTLTLNLGGAQAMVQVTRSGVGASSPGSSAPLFVQSLGAIADTTLTAGSSSPQGSGNLAVSGSTNSANVQRGLLKFDLSQDFGKTITNANLILNRVSGAATNDVQAAKDIFGLTSGNGWTETQATWSTTAAGFTSGFAALPGATLVTVSGLTVSAPVTEAVQRALWAGDSNRNGWLDLTGVYGDINAFYWAVSNPSVYQSAFGGTPAASQSVMRNDISWDNQVSTADIDGMFQRWGAVRGDYNIDGVVDIYDWNVWSSNFGQQDFTISTGGYTRGDGNFNGVIDAADYSFYGSNQGFRATTPKSPQLTLQVVAGNEGVNSSNVYSSRETTNFSLVPKLSYEMDRYDFIVNKAGDAAAINNGAATHDSDSTAPGNQTTLWSALQRINVLRATNPNAKYVISFAPNITSIELNANTLTIPGGDVTIEGPGAELLTITGKGQRRVFDIAAGASVTLKGLTITGGFVAAGQVGAGIRSYGNLFIDGVRIHDNTVADGGEGQNSNGGGVYSQWGSLRILNSVIENNHARWGAGVDARIQADDTLDIRDSIIRANTTHVNGKGAGVVLQADTGSIAMISDSEISGNTSGGLGAGIWLLYGALQIQRTLIANNTAGSTAAGNAYGGGIAAYGVGELVLKEVEVRDNRAYGSGAGIYVQSKNLLIENSTIDHNENDGGAFDEGGGLFIWGPGAGQTVNITGSTISRNESDAEGGLFIAPLGGTVSITNSTISKNKATYIGGVGILWGDGVTFTNTTITANEAVYEAGGIKLRDEGQAKFTNTILAGNDSTGSWPKNIEGTVSQANRDASFNNLIGGSGTGGFTNGTNANFILSGTAINDPKLLPLANYGGARESHLPKPDSPALNAGKPTSAYSDQRGAEFLRSLGAAPDIGAVEANVIQNTTYGAIDIYGTHFADSITLRADGAVLSTLNSQFVPVNLQSATAVTVYGLNGADAISVDTSLTRALTLDGGSGDDILEGGIANDTLYGWGGNDRLIGGGGNDSLYGGPGNDRFVFAGASNQGIDSVFEAFGEGTDKLDFTATRLPHLTRTAPSLTGTARQTVLNERQSASPRLQLEPLSGQSLEGIEGFEGVQPLAFRNTVKVDEDKTYVFKVADFPYALVDQTATAVTISTLQTHGSLKLNGNAVVGSQSIATSAIAAGQLTYTPPLDASGNDFTTVGYQISAGTQISTPTTLTIDVTPVDDQAQIIAPISVSWQFFSTKSFTNAEQIRLTDLDDRGEQRRVVIEATSLGTVQPLQFGSTPPAGLQYGFETDSAGFERICRLWMEGTLVEINTALGLLQLAPATVTFDGAFDLTIALGNLATRTGLAANDAHKTIRVNKLSSTTYPRVSDVYFQNDKLWVSYILASGVNYGTVVVGVGVFEANGGYSSRTVNLGQASGSGTVEIPLATPLPDSEHTLRSLLTTTLNGPPAQAESYTGVLVRSGTYVDAQNQLFIYATHRHDEITIKANEWTFNGVTAPLNANSYSRIIINGRPGADTITIDPAITTPVSLYGGPGEDFLVGGAGNDILSGGPGIDILEGWVGNDTLTGGSSESDTFRFSGAVSLGLDQLSVNNDTLDLSGLDYGIGATLDIQAAKASTNYLVVSSAGKELRLNLGAGATNTSVIGTKYNDDLRGDTGHNRLTGGGGDDYLAGRHGNDTYAFVGDDGDLGTDTIVEAASQGTDTVDFSSFRRTLGGVVFDLSSQSSSYPINTPGHDLQGEGGLTLNLSQAVQLENVIGSPDNDQLSGNSLINAIYGQDGDDTILNSTGSSKDFFYEGAGNDTYRFVQGGAPVDILADPASAASGADTLDFSALNAGVAISLASNSRQTQAGVFDLLISSGLTLENITGTNFNDTLTGNTAANILSGGNGNDLIFAGAGDDTIAGGTGNDDLNGEAGDDFILADAGDDILRGGDHADTLYAGDGADDLYGGDGVDSLYGGIGFDDYRIASLTEDYQSDYIYDEDQSELPGGVPTIGPSGQVNHRPTFGGIAATYSASVGTQLLVPLLIADPDASQTYTVTAVSQLPTFASVSTQSFRWTPRPEDLGTTINIDLRVQDSGAPQLADTVRFQITVTGTRRKPSLTLTSIDSSGELSFAYGVGGDNPNNNVPATIQRRLIGGEWEQFQNVSTSSVVYSNTYLLQRSDARFVPGQLCEYRLQVLDVDGSYSYSPLVSAEMPRGFFSAFYPSYVSDTQTTLNWTFTGVTPQSFRLFRVSLLLDNTTFGFTEIGSAPISASAITFSHAVGDGHSSNSYFIQAYNGPSSAYATAIYIGEVILGSYDLAFAPMIVQGGLGDYSSLVTTHPNPSINRFDAPLPAPYTTYWLGFNNDFDGGFRDANGPVSDYLSTSDIDTYTLLGRNVKLYGSHPLSPQYSIPTVLESISSNLQLGQGSGIPVGSNIPYSSYNSVATVYYSMAHPLLAKEPSVAKNDSYITTRHKRVITINPLGIDPQTSVLIDEVKTATITVVEIDLEIAGIGNLEEFTKGAIIRRNSDFSKNNRLATDGQLLPDYNKNPNTNTITFDPSSATDYVPAKVTWNADVHQDLQIYFTIPDNVIVWDVTDGLNDARKIVSGQRFWAQHDGLDIMIEGLERSSTLATDSIKVAMVDPSRPTRVVDDDEAKYTVVELDALVDGNRDGVMSQSDAADRNLVFWYNTDVDRTYGEFQNNTYVPLFGYLNEPLFDVGSDLVSPPAVSPLDGTNIQIDAFDRQIVSPRDLEDFASLSFYVDPLLENGTNRVEYSLELDVPEGSTTVGLNVFENFKHSEENSLRHVQEVVSFSSIVKGLCPGPA